MKSVRLVVVVGLVAVMSAACGATGVTPPPNMTATTLTAGWEQHFSFEWTASDQGPSSRKVSGYVYNRYGDYAITLRLLARAVDANGAVVGQRITSIPGGVGGFGRAYFEVPDLPIAAGYQLSVWEYTWFQSDGKM